VMLSPAAYSASADDFYQGKQIKIVVGSAVGGGYDAYARLLSRHWSKHIPGQPQIIIQNMAGAGGLASMNYVANVAAHDGLTVGAVQNIVVYEPLIARSGGKSNARFDALKVNWIGSMTKEASVTVLWNPPPVHSLQELIDTKKDIVLGTTAPSTLGGIATRVMNQVFGTHIKLVTGYPNQAPIWLALERGELQGASSFYSSLINSRPDWIRDHKVTVIEQITLEKHPDLPDVPLLVDFMKTDEDRQTMELLVASTSMGRPYVLPEGVPAERVKVLSDSFMATMKDAEFLADARQQRLEINAIDGVAVHHLIEKMYAMPQPIVDKVTALLTSNKEQ
jgi:tripartite-type tricarboxylate transporter receptor subunit TctC